MRHGLVLIAAVAASGCGLVLAQPEPADVDPPWGYNGEETLVQVSGQHFFPRVEVDATGRSSAEVDQGFRLELVGPDGGSLRRALVGVTYESTRSLRALVPAGLPPGTYDLVVEGPTGRRGELPAAFTVTDTRADRLSIDIATVVFEVHQTAWMDLTLLDPSGQRVLADLEVNLRVEGQAGPVVARFEDGSLQDQVNLPDGVSGRLGDNGRARVGLVVETPDLVTLTAEPVNHRSGVAADSVKLLWEPGTDLSLQIDLPSDPFDSNAGQSFAVDLALLDQFGNPAPDAFANVWLQDACAGWVAAVPVSGTATADVVLTAATGSPECPFNRISSVLGPPGESAAFQVYPGPVSRFQIDVDAPSIVAGEHVNAFLTPVDDWGNRAPWSGTLDLTDSVSGVSGFDCVGASPIYCSVESVVAAPEVRLLAEGSDGTSGTSSPYEVRPGAPATVNVDVRLAPATAGEPLLVTVLVHDAWGNGVDAALIDPETFQFTDLDGPADCLATGPPSEGAAWFDCTFTQARDDNLLSVFLPDLELAGASLPFEVHNGPLASVQVEVPPDPVVGQPHPLDLAGFDAFGNPYATGSTLVEVADTGGALEPAALSLGPDGTLGTTVSFALAGPTRVQASVAGLVLGESEEVVVQAGEAVALAVEVEEPWAFVGQGTPVRVRAVDGFANTVDLAGEVTLASATGSGPLATLALESGEGEVAYTWAQGALDEVLLASLDDLEGESAPLWVVEDCGSDGPEAVMRFSGFDEAIACFDEAAEQALVSVSFAGSTPGLAPIAVQAVALPDAVQVDEGEGVVLALPEPGVFPVRGLVADDAACGHEVGSMAWVGLDDGQPVGPLQVSVDDASLEAGLGSTGVHITGAVDCTRDLAFGGEVRLRVDRGRLLGLEPTGSGLALTLDATGSGSATLDVTEVSTGGPAQIVAWTAGGAAFGGAGTSVTGDHARPVVWEQHPSGAYEGPIGALTLRFSEPMLESTLTPDRFLVEGPESATVAEVLPAPGFDEVEIVLQAPIEASLGTWTVTALSTVRDEAGNLLDGAWDGGPGDYEGFFGDLPPLFDPVTLCEPDRPLFRPDGDDGEGPQADEVEVALESASAPVAWVLSILDAQGELLRRDVLPATGPIQTWRWDGRDVAERVVDNGAYTITVDADDGLGNRGGSCDASVIVDNRNLE